MQLSHRLSTCYNKPSCIPPITIITDTFGDRRQFNEVLEENKPPADTLAGFFIGMDLSGWFD